MTLSTNVSVNTPMSTPMNQTQTTSPTEGGVDQGSRPPVSRHILSIDPSTRGQLGHRRIQPPLVRRDSYLSLKAGNVCVNRH